MTTASLSVVVFSGGRGSSVLSRDLIARSDVSLTLAINGYDDGLSTGEVRRFLGDALGPSDFRKNASHLARILRTCDAALLDTLDTRLPVGASREEGRTALERLAAGSGPLTEPVRAGLRRFEQELQETHRPFDFSDCSIGNLVFAGAYLLANRSFNQGLDDYCSWLGLEPGLIENVSDGTNAYLVAMDVGDRLLASEAEIVDATRRNRIQEIYLLPERLDGADLAALEAMPPGDAAAWLSAREQQVPANPRLLERVAAADIIVYSPGTQHSSLFPSYLTHGLRGAIARNLTAVKLLITNIQADAEIAGATAVEIIERAVYYLAEKGRCDTPTPCLITHYLINDPSAAVEEKPYVPLGRLESLEDPRLVRIANYEDGVTGRHDPAKVLAPFLRSRLGRHRLRVAVWLHDAATANKVAQSIVEMVRADLEELPLDVAVLHAGPALGSSFLETLPFPVTRVLGPDGATKGFPTLVTSGAFDYVMLFDSSGMYHGEDLVTALHALASGRLDAVWGSRRLSVTDIEASIRLRYRHHRWLRTAANLGSHALSLACLLLYGRYVSDTLSGVRAVRTSFLYPDDRLDDVLLNQRLLSRLLRCRAEFLETPVRFYAMSPGQVRRTSVTEGLRALAMMAWWRIAPDRVERPASTAAIASTMGSRSGK